VENFTGLTMQQMPVALLALFAGGTFALIVAGLLAVRAVTRSRPDGRQP
jgi:hypothetical protein